MLLIMLFVILTVGFWSLAVIFKYDDYLWVEIGKWVSTGALAILGLVIIINRHECHGYALEIEEARRSIAEQRQLGNVENAALSVKIVEVNSSLVYNQRFANSKWFNWFWTDEVRNLTPLK